MTTTIVRRSPRIHALGVRKFGDVKKMLLLESRNVFALIVSPTGEYNKKRSQQGVDVVIRIYNIIIENFRLILSCNNTQLSTERLLQVMYQRIEVLREQIIQQKLNTKRIIPIFNTYIKQYHAYHRNKIRAMVLLTRRFPPDIVRLISTYYLSPTNFVQ